MNRRSGCASDVRRRVGSMVVALLPGIGAAAPAGTEFCRLPLSFVPNRGQEPAGARFVARGPGCRLELRTDAVGVVLPPARNEAAGDERALDMRFVDPDGPGRIAGEDPLPGTVNYLIGGDPASWRCGIPTYARVRYTGVWRGIDLVFRGEQGRLEYDILVAPGADPARVQFEFTGADAVFLGDDGGLVVRRGSHTVMHLAPVVYQETAGAPQPVAGAFRVAADGRRVGFAVAAYDASRPLVIDPVWLYSATAGGSDDDIPGGVAVDAAGCAYIAGWTYSSNFPVVAASTPTSSPIVFSAADVFITKLDPSGRTVLFSTYFGGYWHDAAHAIAVDGDGFVYLTGDTTSSSDFPLTNAWQPYWGGSSYGDAFVAKFAPGCTALVYSTYLGGTDVDEGLDIVADATGRAYVVGRTSSANFPLRAAYQNVIGGNGDVFVARFPPGGNPPDFSTFLGGSGSEVGEGIALDAAGNILLAGYTMSANFPVTNALYPSFRGGFDDAFVAKMSGAGTSLLWSTYLGGSGIDEARAVAAAPSGAVCVAGHTFSANFPAARALYGSLRGSEDAFVTLIDAAGTGIVFSTFLGGLYSEEAMDVAIGPTGQVCIAGYTYPSNFPLTNALQSIPGGDWDAFVAQLSPNGQALEFCSLLAGGRDERAAGIAVNPYGNLYVVGETRSTNFPSFHPFSPAGPGGAKQLFVCKIDPDPAPDPSQFGAPRLEGGGPPAVVLQSQPQRLFQVEVSSNLTDWASAGALFVTNGAGALVDTNPAMPHWRLYRYRSD